MSDLYIPINYDQVPEEIQQLAGNLFTSISYFFPGLKAEVDENEYRFSAKVDTDIVTQHLEQIGAIPSSNTTPENKFTSLEKTIIEGIQEVIDDNILLEAPPNHPAKEELLALYADALNNKDYTTVSVLYEIGRIIDTMTYRLSQHIKNAEAKRLYKKNVSKINSIQKDLMAIRIYQYFQNNKEVLLYGGIDSYLKPNNIGRINQKNSDNLKRKINSIFN